MKCFICGQEILDYGNNPFPLCDREDMDSRCCNDCDNTVIQARMIQMRHEQDKPEIDKLIIIFYSKNSDAPTESIRNTGKFLAGKITEINEEKKTCRGEFGNFEVDLDYDNYIILNI